MSTHTNNNSSKEYLPEAGTVCELWWGGVFNDVVEVIQYRKHTIIFWSIKRDTVDSAEMPTAQLKPMSEVGRYYLQEIKPVTNSLVQASVSHDLLYLPDYMG